MAPRKTPLARKVPTARKALAAHNDRAPRQSRSAGAAAGHAAPPAFDAQAFLDSSAVAKTVSKYDRGESVFVQGDASSHVMYIQTGGIKLSVVSKAQMIALLRKQHAMSDRFIAHMLTRNIRIEEDLIDQLFNSAEKRLARTLLLLARYGKQDKPIRVVPQVSQETLAEMVGTTRSRVNFFLNKFKKLGFIEYEDGVPLKVNSSLLGVVLHRLVRLAFLGCSVWHTGHREPDAGRRCPPAFCLSRRVRALMARRVIRRDPPVAHRAKVSRSRSAPESDPGDQVGGVPARIAGPRRSSRAARRTRSSRRWSWSPRAERGSAPLRGPAKHDPYVVRPPVVNQRN